MVWRARHDRASVQEGFLDDAFSKLVFGFFRDPNKSLMELPSLPSFYLTAKRRIAFFFSFFFLLNLMHRRCVYGAGSSFF